MANPHDTFVKATFSEPRNAAAYLERFLPPAIVAAVDLAEVELEPGSYVEESLAERHSDLLFRAPLHSPSSDDGPAYAFVYVLFEHQSTVEPLMPYRLLRYMVRIWDRWLKDQRELKPVRLPAIVPHVLYHGAGAWTVGPGLLDLLAVSPALRGELEPHTPHFDFVLTDLSRYSDDELRLGAMSGAMSALALLALKHHSADDLLPRLYAWTELFRQLLDQGTSGLHGVKLVLEYVVQAASHVGGEELSRFCAQELGPAAEEIAMTAAEHWKNEGRAQGRAEGRAELLLRQVELKFGSPSTAVRRRIEEAGSEQIDSWAERILTAASVDALFGADADGLE